MSAGERPEATPRVVLGGVYSWTVKGAVFNRSLPSKIPNLYFPAGRGLTMNVPEGGLARLTGSFTLTIDSSPGFCDWAGPLHQHPQRSRRANGRSDGNPAGFEGAGDHLSSGWKLAGRTLDFVFVSDVRTGLRGGNCGSCVSGGDSQPSNTRRTLP